MNKNEVPESEEKRLLRRGIYLLGVYGDDKYKTIGEFREAMKDARIGNLEGAVRAGSESDENAGSRAANYGELAEEKKEIEKVLEWYAQDPGETLKDFKNRLEAELASQ